MTERVATCIEELATDLLLEQNLEEARDRWASSLIGLSELAQSSGIPEIALLATSAAQVIKQKSGAEAAQELERTLGSLREAASRHQAAPAPAPMPAATIAIADDPELLADFVSESREHLENIEAQLLALEQDACNKEVLHSIFRSFHTIKGLAGFLELSHIQEVTHDVETVLDKAREGEFRLTPKATDVVLESKDYVAAWLRYLDHGRSAPPPAELLENRALIRRVKDLLSAPADDADEPVESEPEASNVEQSGAEQQPTVSATGTEARSLRTQSRSVKVDTAKLDYLVDMVGEMVIAQSMVRHDPELGVAANPRLARNLSQLTRITDEVQRTAMSMRMVPIGPLFQKMARLVRDLSRKFGKQIQFVAEGEDVELDRNIVEELADPLMHMVRNAVDHGIETPSQRAATDKPPAATVSLRAFHRSGQIVIQIVDDGRGINRERVLAKARANGLISANASLSDAECFALIFAPGFSTAEQVSNVSGRGVGMDVVKKQIQKLRGSVDIDSVEGKGTTFSLRLPLTLAIIDGLVVAVGKKRYILPLASVKEMLRPTPDMVRTVEGRAEVVVIRDRVVPMIRLYERFGTEPRTTEPSEAVLVVADLDGTPFSIMVDDLIGKQEVVIKSLGPMFQHVAGVAGGAILGDGQVGLILDLASLFGGKADV